MISSFLPTLPDVFVSGDVDACWASTRISLRLRFEFWSPSVLTESKDIPGYGCRWVAFHPHRYFIICAILSSGWDSVICPARNRPPGLFPPVVVLSVFDLLHLMVECCAVFQWSCWWKRSFTLIIVKFRLVRYFDRAIEHQSLGFHLTSQLEIQLILFYFHQIKYSSTSMLIDHLQSCEIK